MDEIDHIKIETGDSENIINISSETQENIDIHSFYIGALINNIILLKNYFEKNIKNNESSEIEKINSYFAQISSILNLLSDEKDNIFSQYESSLRKNEQHIRSLYSDIFNLKIKNIFLENNIEVLLRKEKEYRLVKEKTGIYVENGAIIYNDRKENEIFILRKENSTLKNVITNTEKELNELKDKYKADKKMYETKISKLNHKLEQLKLKIKQNNHKVKNKSYSSLNTNSNNITTPNLKLNFSINNNSVSKGYNNSRPKTNRENNNNNINNSNIANKDININNNKYNKYFEFFILNPKEKKTNKNTITYERQN